MSRVTFYTCDKCRKKEENSNYVDYNWVLVRFNRVKDPQEFIVEKHVCAECAKELFLSLGYIPQRRYYPNNGSDWS